MMRTLLALILWIGLWQHGKAQNIPFSSGPIPLCDTSTFTADVYGVGYLVPLGTWGGSTLYSLMINITSDHPQTLQISLTSPGGTTLLLSAFNGGGGQNYTGTNFIYDPSPAPSITTGTAPFTGIWTPEGGSLSAFDYQYADGTWTITVIDTACANGGNGSGGSWTPGWFDGSGATGGFSFAFNPPPPPDCWGSIPNETTTICSGESVDILGYYESLGYGYTYYVTTASGQVLADPTVVTEPGTYWIDAWDPWSWANCTYYATYDVVLSGPSLGPDQDIDQCGDAGPVDLTSLFPSGPLTSWSFNGSPISTVDAMNAVVSGTYQIMTDPGMNCGDTATATLNFFAELDLGADQTVNICTGETADLTALYNTAGLTATWNFAGSAIAVPTSVSEEGTYSLIAITADGCSDTAEVILVVGSAPVLGADQNISFCSNATIDLTTLFNTAGFTSTWSYLQIPVNDPTAIIAGGSYQLIASSGGSCTDTAMVYVTAEPAPVLGSDLLATTCEGEGEDIASYFTTTGLTTQWSFAGAPVADPSSVMDEGTYTLIATNVAGCSDTGVVDLDVVEDPVLGPDQTLTVCDGAAVDLNSIIPSGSNTALWSLSGTPVPDPGSVTEAGIYTLVATNNSGCSSTATLTIDLEVSPSLGNDQAHSICEGSSFDLTSLYETDLLTPSWTLSGAIVTDPSSVDLSGIYRLIVTNDGGCTDTAFVQLTVNENPMLGPDQTFPICPWQVVDLVSAFSIGNMSASFMLNDQSVNDPDSIADAGIYTIIVTNASGCSDTAMATVIDVECMCVADFTENARCMQDPVQFTLLADSSIISAAWNFNGAADNSAAIDPEVRFNSEGEVRVSLRATLGCGVVEIERTIRIEDCSDSCSVWIPSSFTPDGDGINDRWAWVGECAPQDFNMQVFDRLGELIFTSSDPRVTWDGNFKGEASPLGVYVYRAAYRLPYQDRKEVMGSITLVR